jgi:hypothetical protein
LSSITFTRQELKQLDISRVLEDLIDFKGLDVQTVTTGTMFHVDIIGIEVFFYNRFKNKQFRRVLFQRFGDKYTLNVDKLQSKINELAEMKRRNDELAAQDRREEEEKDRKILQLRDETGLVIERFAGTDERFLVHLVLTEDEVRKIAKAYHEITGR